MDSKTHIVEAHLSAPGKEFTDCITRKQDEERDDVTNPPVPHKRVVEGAKLKMDASLITRQKLDLEQGINTADKPISVLQAAAELQKKETAELKQQLAKKKKQKRKCVPFPREPQNAPAPSDASIPGTINGEECHCCKKHQKWGRHSTMACQLDDPAMDTPNTTPNADTSGGTQGGRAVRRAAEMVPEADR